MELPFTTTPTVSTQVTETPFESSVMSESTIDCDDSFAAASKAETA
ncbi:MAG: hypothetical protein MRK02_05860 [Candidatus Scalindua sp.]|nr:hypothetical protein [Candidatus Scalindua sp.]